MPWWSSMKQPKMWSRNVARMSSSFRSTSVAAWSMNVWPFMTQWRCLSSTCSARSRKYGIHPISPSDRAIFRLG